MHILYRDLKPANGRASLFVLIRRKKMRVLENGLLGTGRPGETPGTPPLGLLGKRTQGSQLTWCSRGGDSKLPVSVSRPPKSATSGANSAAARAPVQGSLSRTQHRRHTQQAE